MVVFAFPILPDLKDDGVEPLSHPADRPVLCREIGALVKVIGVHENTLCLLKADSTLWVRPQSPALARIKVESHLDITVIPQFSSTSSHEPASASRRIDHDRPWCFEPLWMVVLGGNPMSGGGNVNCFAAERMWRVITRAMENRPRYACWFLTSNCYSVLSTRERRELSLDIPFYRTFPQPRRLRSTFSYGIRILGARPLQVPDALPSQTSPCRFPAASSSSRTHRTTLGCLIRGGSRG